MLSGTRGLTGRRTKRTEKYTNEEAESMLVDAESIQLFVDNTSRISAQEVYKGINQRRFDATNSSANAKEFKPLVFESAKCKVNLPAEERQITPVPTDTSVRSPRKEKALHKSEGDEFPEITATLSSPTFDIEDDLFISFEKFNHRKNYARKVRNRLGENLSQSSPEGWDLCNEKYHAESTFKFNSVPIKKGAKNYDDRAMRSDLTVSEGKLVFLDIFEESKQNALSGSSNVENELESPGNRHLNLRKVRSHSEKNHTNHDLFTDFSFSDEESTGTNSLREFPWGKSNPGELQPCGGTPGKVSHSKSTRRNLYPGKDIQEQEIPEEKNPKEDSSKLMEDSEDLVNVLNSSEDQFTDSQGEKSFVCLVDQLTDLRVRQKFDSHYAGRRRQAVCEELEKTLVWNEKSLYEHRRDLNVRKALNNMFM